MSDTADRLRAALGGRYQVGDLIGRGGMASVFAAHDLKHDRPVAIKVLRPEQSAALGIERFNREIQVAARLRHPHIVPLFDSGEIPGPPYSLYYIMPRIDGESLRSLVEREGPLPEPLAARIAQDVAGALDHAHQAGVIHRDIKPENVLLEGGHALVSDFGISRALGALRDKEAAASHLTETGSAIGTPAYMSPEQIEGRADINGRTDIYSLGCMLFEMLTGRAPYTGPTATAVAARHLVDPVPSVRTLRPEIPVGVDRAVRRAMSKSPDDRYATAGAFIAALREGESGPVAAPAARNRRLAIGAVVVAVLLVAAAVLWRNRTPAADPPSNSTLAILPFTVRGADTLNLGEGIVTLLSTKMDGAGELRTVDGRALLSYLEDADITSLDPVQGRRIARQFSAGLFVLGEAVIVGSRVQLTARLYSEDEEEVPPAATEEGELANLFELADRLAARLIAEQEGGAAGSLGQVAGVSTKSLPAFKAFLDGESAMRTGRFDEALAAYRRATAADSGFALAWYRMSVAAQWLTREDIVREGVYRAERLSTQLPERYRQLVQATRAGVEGNLEQAERIYRGILSSYPDDIEAWMQLGELLFHTAPIHGRDFRESAQPWNRVIAFEPNNLIPLIHLARIAAADRDTAGLDSMVRQVKRIRAGSGQTIAAARAEEHEMAAMLAAVRGDSAGFARALDSLSGGTSLTVVITVLDVATYAGNLPYAIKLSGLLTRASNSPEIRANGYLLRAGFRLAQGHWASARVDFDSAALFDAGLATAYRAYFRSAPFMRVSAESLLVERARLDGIRAPATPPPPDATIQFAVHQGLYDYYREYLKGIYAALAGDVAAAERAMGALMQVQGSGDQLKLSRNQSAGIRAEVALRQGRPAEALRALETIDISISYLLQLSPFYAGPRERYRRAELYEEAERLDDALHWYTTLDNQNYLDLPYVPPSLLRRGRILERLGRGPEARALYQRALTLWTNPDSTFLPMVVEAREGVARVGR